MVDFVGNSGKKWELFHTFPKVEEDMFFRGRSTRNIDPKGRLMFSPEFREILASRSPDSKVVLTTYDGCVVGFPFPEWETFEDKINRIANPSRAVRDFRRLVLGGAEEMTFDGQGRLRLSKDHLVYGGIEREVIIMGQGPRFELWSPERLNPVLAQNFDDVASDIADAGIDFGF